MNITFYHHGQKFTVNEHGHINGSPAWILLGVSFHHWRNGIDLPLDKCLANPKAMIGGLVWDKDHGTTRQWAGRYAGRLPRVTSAWQE